MSDINNQIIDRTLPKRHRRRQLFGRLIGKRIEHLLSGLEHGQLSLTWPDGHTSVHGRHDGIEDNNVSVVLKNFRPIQQLMLSGEVGFAESYLRGDWTTDCLSRFFTLIVRNENSLSHGLSGIWAARFQQVLHHWSNRNSLRGSQRNITFHYDLGNEFYRLWLDPSMNYSSALYADDSQPLALAQQNKMQRVVDLLEAAPGSQVLEIGCGWGAMANKLATDTGCCVTGISLSSEQLDYARLHNAEVVQSSEDVTASVDFHHRDYRAVTGKYQHIVSIEMFEAVGEQYWETYFSKLADLLEHGGTAVLQVITILEERFEFYKKNPDFIQRYIFPGGMLPTKTQLRKLSQNAGLELMSTEWYGASYARTLVHWRELFEKHSRDVVAQGFDERFMRMWRYYLAYCETGFALGTTDVGMLLLKKH